MVRSTYGGCTTCGDPLNRDSIKCQKCKEVFHRQAKCTGISADNLDRIAKWYCYICEPCFYCQNNEEDEESYICDGCNRNFHIKCLDPPVSAGPSDFYDKWFCGYCSTNLCIGCWLPVHSLSDGICLQCQSTQVCGECTEFYEEEEVLVQCQWCLFFYHEICEDLSGPDGKCKRCADHAETDNICKSGCFFDSPLSFEVLDGVEMRMFRKRLLQEKMGLSTKYEMKRPTKLSSNRVSTQRSKLLASGDDEVKERLKEAENFFGTELLYYIRDDAEEDFLKYFERHETTNSSNEEEEIQTVLGAKVERELKTQMMNDVFDQFDISSDQLISPSDWMAGFRSQPNSPSLWTLSVKKGEVSRRLVPQSRAMILSSPHYQLRKRQSSNHAVATGGALSNSMHNFAQPISSPSLFPNRNRFVFGCRSSPIEVLSPLVRNKRNVFTFEYEDGNNNERNFLPAVESRKRDNSKRKLITKTPNGLKSIEEDEDKVVDEPKRRRGRPRKSNIITARTNKARNDGRKTAALGCPIQSSSQDDSTDVNTFNSAYHTLARRKSCDIQSGTSKREDQISKIDPNLEDSVDDSLENDDRYQPDSSTSTEFIPRVGTLLLFDWSTGRTRNRQAEDDILFGFDEGEAGPSGMENPSPRCSCDFSSPIQKNIQRRIPPPLVIPDTSNSFRPEDFHFDLTQQSTANTPTNTTNIDPDFWKNSSAFSRTPLDEFGNRVGFFTNSPHIYDEIQTEYAKP